MKKLFFLSLILSLTINVCGNNVQSLQVEEPVTEKKAVTHISDAEALKYAEYLLNNPINKDKDNRLIITGGMMKWMADTPDYMFVLGDEEDMKLIGKSTEIFSVYLAAMTKAALDSAPQKLSEDELRAKTVEIFLDYCANASNKVKYNKEVKKRLSER